MHDRLFESSTFPQHFPLNRFQRPLVLAPHPDDEVFGCGGTLALFSQRGVQAQVVVLTSGDEQGESHGRQAESRAAAQILGHVVEFWQLADRGLRCGPQFVDRLAQLLDSTQCDVVFVPALYEPHPDHQAATLALLWAIAAKQRPVDICFYESGSTLIHCTHVVDITAVAELKKRALDAFASQEFAQPYRSRIIARDHFRAMTLGPGAEAAEGFHWVPLGGKGWPALLPALDPLFLHARHQAVVPEDLPLVSVLVRTVGDPALEQAIASVRAQTYPCIELVVVAAHGQERPPEWLQVLASSGTGCRVRWVCHHQKLTRPQAANAALQAATGIYCIFLDDDDLFAPGHVEKLVHLLRSQPTARAAHTDTQVINAEGEQILSYDKPYIPERLVFSNVFPIHSVLFERTLLTQDSCRFDEALPVMEDWDFWLQVSGHTGFPHVPGMSAIYRYRDRSQLRGDAQHEHHHRHWRDLLMAKWADRLPAQHIREAGFWYAQQLDHTEQLLVHAQNQKGALEQALQQSLQARAAVEHAKADALQQLDATQQALAAVEHGKADALQQLAQAQHRLSGIYASRGWRALGVLRRVKRLITGAQA